MKKESVNKLIIVGIFAIAMGFLEATVVVYLRELYYTNGFDFPLKGFIEPNILSIEWIREFATIVMLVTIGILAGKKLYERFAYFLYAFAIWDIFYYIFLKMTLNWPPSLFTWDILFLIPLPWVGPVLAPVLCSILMIITTLLIISLNDKGKKLKIKLSEALLVILGILIVLYTWLYDYGNLIISGGFAKQFFTLSYNQEFYQLLTSYIPQTYNWILFIIGFLISTIGIIMFYIRNKK